MGTSDEEGNPSLETHSEINQGISSNGTHHDVVVVVEQDDDDDDQNQNQDQNQSPYEEAPAIVEKLESLELQGNGSSTHVEERGESEEKEEEEEGKTHNYPLRPNAVDCTFYLKTGTCKFGLNCRFNHPPNRVFQPAGDKEKGIKENNGVVPDSGKIECKYFSTPGGCKYGDACRYNHSKEKIGTEGPELNFLGLPIRPLEKECTFYMRNGTCSYGANCRFHHPNPTAPNEFDGNSIANGSSFRGGNNSPKTYEPLYSSGVLQVTLPDRSNGIHLRNTLPFAAPPSMSSYHGMLQNPGWNQNQVTMSLTTNKPPLPHQIVNKFSKTIDPSTHYEHLMQVDEFPVRPGQPDCDYFMKTGDCKYRSACRYNHPLTRTPKLRLPPLSMKVSHSRSTTVLPVENTELPNSNPNNTRNNGVPSHHHHQAQNGEFPERPGQPECEYFMKTGNCKFSSACRYHHPRNRVSPPSPSALNEKGLPLRPGNRICRNYEQQGTCKYGRNCLFHHPDDSSPPIQAPSVVAPQDHNSTDVAVTADSNIPVNSNDASDWGDGWAT